MFHKHLKFNKYMQFGGHVELDEHPWEAVAHEVREESGYDLDQLQVLQPPDRPIIQSDVVILPQPVCLISALISDVQPVHYHDDIAWAFVTHELPRHEVDARESDVILLLSRSQIAAATDDEMFLNVKEITLFIFDTVLPKWQPVFAIPLSPIE